MISGAFLSKSRISEWMVTYGRGEYSSSHEIVRVGKKGRYCTVRRKDKVKESKGGETQFACGLSENK